MRRLRADEWARWRELRLAALADSPRAFGATLADNAARPDEFWQERARAAAEGDAVAIFVAVAGARWVGCAGALVDPGEPPRVISVWVAPDFRGTGTAEALLEAVVGWAAERGHAALHLDVVREQVAARRLYARLGFRPTGRSHPMDRDPRLLEDEMRLELGAPERA